MPYQIDQPNCSCCHQCKVNCPVGAIHFKGAKYWIDAEKCIDCGKCARICHNSVITKVGEAAPTPEAHPGRHLDCDLVVLGAGGSGLIAAVRFVMATGRKAIVLEKAKKTGGNTWYAHGWRTMYSRMMQEKGMEDTREQTIREFLTRTLWREDPQLVRNVYESNARFTDWLTDDLGYAGDAVLAPSHWGGLSLEFVNRELNAFKRPDTSIGPGEQGSYIVLRMLEQCEKLGIPVLTEHEAKHILLDSEGKVCGVEAQDPGGKTIVHCSACVLATGCFSRNEELVRRADPDIFLPGEPIHYFSVPTCTGDGIRMAEEVGADIDYVNLRAANFGPAHHPFGFASVCISRQPEVVFFNLDGCRWAGEEESTMALRHLFLKQPGLVNYAVADSAIVETCIQHLIDSGRDGEAGAAIFRNYKNELEEESKLDTPTKKADTLEELAQLMGVPVDTFLAEVAHYNEMCHAGHDTDFFKSPQYLMPLENPPIMLSTASVFRKMPWAARKSTPRPVSWTSPARPSPACTPAATIPGASSSPATWALTS